ncbi:23S rRNA (guanosine-2'-O-) -methyltransferase RlmB [Photobacterium aphoticum]|uniref:23S rRNA (Guanosine-2'-O-)-methyltransferase RlmB n=1 Tax=Photobacterium aphoticum TaxID=754436 RepID=A0A090R2P2_9GAMM|nr:23S rRNA (guanosine-2'-O-) -methyltransferase RlmB [Photobacterium aphoticum]
MIFGIHAVNAVLASDPSRFIEVFVLKDRQDERLLPVINELQMLGITMQQAGRKALDDKVKGASHQGIVHVYVRVSSTMKTTWMTCWRAKKTHCCWC